MKCPKCLEEIEVVRCPKCGGEIPIREILRERKPWPSFGPFYRREEHRPKYPTGPLAFPPHVEERLKRIKERKLKPTP